MTPWYADLYDAFIEHGVQPRISSYIRRSLSHQEGISRDVTTRPIKYELLAVIMATFSQRRADRARLLGRSDGAAGEDVILMQLETDHIHITVLPPSLGSGS